ncbi:AAA family ATPase [Microcoleus sp. B4-C5]|uniref:AAA family ATPase n=1 Tax=unclassified Microcoleus TaxID=2642155 RepID=UPI002FCEE1AB
MLRDLTIQNYRCFKDFHIDELARVNLIVGQNNSGKTTFLEAIYLLVNEGNIPFLFEVLNSRGEITLERSRQRNGEVVSRRYYYHILHIFYGHQLNNFDRAIDICSTKEHLLSLKIQPNRILQQLTLPGFEDLVPSGELVAELVVSYGQYTPIRIPIRSDRTGDWRYLELGNTSQLVVPTRSSNQNYFLTTTNRSFQQLSLLWDRITLTPKEQSVVEALQILEPDVERISFTSRQTSNSGILLKLRGQPHPVPLGSMGEGMRRILSIAMAAVSSENGFLLVDEIDTGLYYQTQTDMWRLIFETAQRLNVQVFATTHSWDCIAAFQEALEQSEDSSVGKLFRLSRRGEDIRAVEYTPDELSVAVRQSIEVR